MKVNSRYKEYIRKENFKKSWLLSSNFSKQMYTYTKDNISILSKEQLVDYYKSIMGQYKGEINFLFKENYKLSLIHISEPTRPY